MGIVVGAQSLSAIWQALHKPLGKSLRENSDSVLREIGRRGWAQRIDVEDALFDSEPRLYGLDVNKVAAGLSLNWRAVYPLPQAAESEVWGERCLSAEDAAHLLILIGELGFRMELTPLNSMLLPRILEKHEITESERAVLRYKKERHRQCVVLKATADTSGARSWPSLITAEGYKAQIYLDEGEQPIWMRIIGPRYRAKRDALITP